MLIGSWELGPGSQCKLRRERRIEVTKPFDPKKKRHLETANLESIGTWFRMVRNWELSLRLDHLDILERYLLSLPEEKVFTNARWVCRQPYH